MADLQSYEIIFRDWTEEIKSERLAAPKQINILSHPGNRGSTKQQIFHTRRSNPVLISWSHNNQCNFFFQGFKLKMDDVGNILIKRVSKSGVRVKNTVTEESAVSNDILKLPGGMLETEKPFKVIDSIWNKKRNELWNSGWELKTWWFTDGM